MQSFTCPGLRASWVNAWLAAVGATVLDGRIRLRWTVEEAPVAVLSTADLNPVEALADAWPSQAFLRELPIARRWNEAGELERKVTVEQFVARVRKARGHRQAWALSSTMTDLSVDKNDEVAHSAFDPAGPGTTKWLHHRLLKIHELIGAARAERLRESLTGQANRVKNNGLGFDCTRLGSLADASDPWIEPVVELLAFFGLAVLPVRGQGMDWRSGDPDRRQRGWRRRRGDSGRRRFVWPAWQQPLDTAGIDALLDAWNPWRKQSWASLGVHAAWQSVQYQLRAPADRTRAIGSEML